jgi:hypothetical protein
MAMRRNHFHSSGNSKRANALKHGYKSGSRIKLYQMQIKQTEYELRYETETLNYVVPERKAKYTPDFVFTKRNGGTMYIETKGRWTTADRTKMKHVLQSNPGIDITNGVSKSNQKLSKTSPTTYETFARKLGIMHVAKKDIPAEWFAECLKPGEEPRPETFF